MKNNIKEFIERNDFNYLGKLEIDYSRPSLVRFSTNLSVNDSTRRQEDVVYLWVSPKENKPHKIIYVGETKYSAEKRWKEHERAFKDLINALKKDNNHPTTKMDVINLLKDNPGYSKKKQRILLTLMMNNNNQELVHVYAKKAEQKEIMNVNVSIRHAEEMAIKRMFNPDCNQN